MTLQVRCNIDTTRANHIRPSQNLASNHIRHFQKFVSNHIKHFQNLTSNHIRNFQKFASYHIRHSQNLHQITSGTLKNLPHTIFAFPNICPKMETTCYNRLKYLGQLSKKTLPASSYVTLSIFQ